jgi:signal peptidase II
MKKLSLWYAALAVGILVCDRLSKLFALFSCVDTTVKVNNFLSFFVVFNRGVSWGVFNSAHDSLFAVVSCFVAIITSIVCFQAASDFKKGILITGYVAVIAGSVSNLFDRIWYHGVIDFIICSYGEWCWPVFNVADIAIVSGVVIMVMQQNKKVLV